MADIAEGTGKKDMFMDNHNKSAFKHFNTSRRRAMQLIAALPLASLLLPNTAAARQTPSSTEGPFYPLSGMRFHDTDNDLVKIEGAVRTAGGEVITLTGRVLTATANL